jgi:hypothetical protein
MTPFEYVVVLISIILGLGITQIMTGVADLVHQWEKVKLYWPHCLWIVLVFIMHVQEWWITYELKQTFEVWRLPTFLFFTLYPVNLFIMARILFPYAPSEGPIDLKQFYFGNFRKFFLMFMVLLVLSVISNVVVNGFTPDQLVLVSLFVVTGWIAFRNYQNEILHKVLTVILLLVLVIVIVVNWNTWLIG